MSDIERRLGEALAAQARAQVPYANEPPPARYRDPLGGRRAPARPRHRRRILLPVAAAAAVLLVAALAGGLDLIHTSSRSPVASVTHRPATQATDSAGEVRIRLLRADVSPADAPVGVGMPVVALFSRRIAEGTDLSRATIVTVDGHRVRAAWFFEYSTHVTGFPVEGHLRLEHYWPADSEVSVSVDARGVSAGRRMRFADDVVTSFRTGPSRSAVVDARTGTIVVSQSGRTLARFPVSLGAAATPTTRGVKVIMSKSRDLCLPGPDLRICHVHYGQRLTYGGELLDAAPWAVRDIEHHVDFSGDGCTDLLPVDAARLYRLLQVGDVVDYPNADGPLMTMSQGLGDWNVPWSTWVRGGVVPTS